MHDAQVVHHAATRYLAIRLLACDMWAAFACLARMRVPANLATMCCKHQLLMLMNQGKNPLKCKPLQVG